MTERFERFDPRAALDALHSRTLNRALASIGQAKGDVHLASLRADQRANWRDTADVGAVVAGAGDVGGLEAGIIHKANVAAVQLDPTAVAATAFL